MNKWRMIVTLVAVVIFVSNMVFADNIDHEVLGDAAARFIMSRKPAGAARPAISEADPAKVRELIDPETGEIAAYVVDLAGGGYAVLGGDETAPPVIAWSTVGRFPAGAAGIDPYVTFIVRDIAGRIAAYPDLPSETRDEIARAWSEFLGEGAAKTAVLHKRWPEQGATLTGGWIETAWTQLDPYNAFCPVDILMDDPHRSPVGCVPVALSQIINHHRYIGGLQLGSADSYFSPCGPGETRGVNIDSDSETGDFPSFDELNIHLTAIEHKYSSGGILTADEIAALNFAVGILAETQYSWTEGSGAADDWFFDNLTVKHGIGYTWSVKSSLDKDFYAILKSNMAEGLPATLMINKTYLCSVNHEVVVDGYSTDGFYHLNFGWGNDSPDVVTGAWYLLPEGMGAGYDLIQTATVNIRPPNRTPGALAASDTVIDLGYATTGESTQAGSVIITNTGDTAVTITGIESTLSCFQLSLDGSEYGGYSGIKIIESGETLELHARCTPDSVGTIRGEVLIQYSGGQYFPL